MNSLYRILNTGIFACICLFGIGKWIGIGEIHFYHFLAAFLMIIILTGMTYLSFRGRIILSLGVAGGLIITILILGTDTALGFISSYLYWLMGTDKWQAEWMAGYEMLQASGIAVLCYVFEAVSERYAVLRRIVGGILIVWLVISLFTGNSIAHICVCFSICYIMLAYVEGMQGHWTKVKNGGIKDYVLWLMPFILVYLIAISLTPAPAEPYNWKFVKDAYHQMSETLTRIGENLFRGNNEDFGTFSGFSEDGSLLGGISNSNKEVMKVRSQVGLMTNVYLTGKIFDTFDGRSWEQVNRSNEQDRYIDTLETMYAVDLYNADALRNYVYSATIKIEYRHFNTGYLFAPLKTINILDRSGGMSFHEEGENFILEKKKGYGAAYDVQFYQMNVDHPEFYHFLENRNMGSEESWRDIRNRYRYSNAQPLQFAELEKHRQNIYDRYLQDINPSTEVKAYLAEITQGAETDIDKLKAIEKALSSYTYNTKIGKLPKTVQSGEDFLDYMLLDSKEGYCTYFATAFILLAWEEGIPARYVQGFCVPMNGRKERVVTSAMAHAWPEVYIDGAGWIPFEPTPGYAEIRYTPWEMIEAVQNDESLLQGAGAGDHYWEEDNIPDQYDDLLEPDELSETEAQRLEYVLPVLGYTALFVLLVCLVMLFIDGMIGKRRYKKKTLSEKYGVQVNGCLRILTMLDCRRGDDETLQELRCRALDMTAGDEPAEEKMTGQLLFIIYYEELIYGKREATVELLQDIKADRDFLLNRLKEKKQYVYYLCRMKLFLLRYR